MKLKYARSKNEIIELNFEELSETTVTFYNNETGFSDEELKNSEPKKGKYPIIDKFLRFFNLSSTTSRTESYDTYHTSLFINEFLNIKLQDEFYLKNMKRYKKCALDSLIEENVKKPYSRPVKYFMEIRNLESSLLFNNIDITDITDITVPSVVETLNQIDDWGDTVWHKIAASQKLSLVPKELFNIESLNLKNNKEQTVWELAKNILNQIPSNLITKELLEMVTQKGNPVFNDEGIVYIKNIISSRHSHWDNFLKSANLEKDFIHRDPRLILNECTDTKMTFSFENISDLKITLKKDGVYVKNNNSIVQKETLQEAVLFIEKEFPNIEQSIAIPKINSSEIPEFVL